MKWLKFMLIACVVACVGLASAQNGGAEDENSTIPFEQRVTAAKGIAMSGLKAIAEEALHNPYNREREPNKYAVYSMDFKRETLSSMDKTIKEFVVRSLESGMSLQSIITASKNKLGWSRWPVDFQMEDIDLLPGVRDEALTDEAWLAPENDVVILYATFSKSTPADIFFFQNSFRAPTKALIRQSPSIYMVKRDADGRIEHADLPMERLDIQLSAGWAVGDIPRLLGFLLLDCEPIPGVAVWSGPSGQVMNFGVTLYTWNEQFKVWEG
ncbi:MAG: hypothetical protein K8F91_26325, partial [Candidatus Obscuribacterales bacterium]|nr:hypothetical protein [Candidatus Obscuribacterales bacterium]